MKSLKSYLGSVLEKTGLSDSEILGVLKPIWELWPAKKTDKATYYNVSEPVFRKTMGIMVRDLSKKCNFANLGMLLTKSKHAEWSIQQDKGVISVHDNPLTIDFFMSTPDKSFGCWHYRVTPWKGGIIAKCRKSNKAWGGDWQFDIPKEVTEVIRNSQVLTNKKEDF